MAEDKGFHPLRHVVLCTTGLQPEQRSDVTSKAQSMGATINMDFTTSTTHLVALGSGSMKYKFVAKNRPDVKVVTIDWIQELHTLWTGGEDVDVAAMEEKHKLPAFCDLNICVTNLLEDERMRVIQLVKANGAEYHADLTRAVTHLVAPDTTGKKYHFAKKWKIKIVSPEWVYDSVERGMVLDEGAYDPRNPPEKRGVGAKPEPPRAPIAPMSGFSPLPVQSGQSAQLSIQPPPPTSSLTKRRLRKSIEGKLGSQKDELWNDIISHGSEAVQKKRNEWEQAEPQLEPETNMQNNFQEPVEEPKTGPFAHMNFYLFQFDGKKSGILSNAVESMGGDVIFDLDAFLHPGKRPQKSIILVPDSTILSDLPELPQNHDILILRYWWLEQCMFSKEYVDPDRVGHGLLYRPREKRTIEGFEKMNITLTGFEGAELLHMTKFVQLLGATCMPQLKKDSTSVLIRNSAPNTGPTGKVEAAADWKIPIVNVSWLWDCAEQSRLLPFDGHLHLPTLKRKREDNELSDRQRRPSPAAAEREVRSRGAPAKEYARTSKLGPDGSEANGSKSGGRRGLDPTSRKSRSGILKGKRICISRALKDMFDELSDLAESLGAEVVTTFSSSDVYPITHLIHESKKANDQSKDYRLAKTLPEVFIVSPAWLKKCKDKGRIVDEYAFPHNKDARPSLILAREPPNPPTPKRKRLPMRGLETGPLPFEEADDSQVEAEEPMRHPTPRFELPPIGRSHVINDSADPPLRAASPQRSVPSPTPPPPVDRTDSSSPLSPPPPLSPRPQIPNPVSTLLKLPAQELTSLLASDAPPRRTRIFGRALSTLSANTSTASHTPDASQPQAYDNDLDVSIDDGNGEEELAATQTKVMYAEKAETVMERRRVWEKVGGGGEMERNVVERRGVVSEARDVRRVVGKGRRRGGGR